MCLNQASTGLWGDRWATAGPTRKDEYHIRHRESSLGQSSQEINDSYRLRGFRYPQVLVCQFYNHRCQHEIGQFKCFSLSDFGVSGYL